MIQRTKRSERRLLQVLLLSVLASPAPVPAGECPDTEWATGFHGYDLSHDVHALAVFDDGGGPALYAGGSFATAGEVEATHIAKWDGTAWSALSGSFGNGLGNTVTALAVFDDGGGPALYASGYFTTAGGVTANRVAKWDGTTWTALGDGLSNVADVLAVFDDGSGPALYAGGSFITAGGITANHVAKWNGTAWTALTGRYGTGVDAPVAALTVFDDGGGPALYVGGHFTTAGGIAANSLAKWDGTTWTALTGPSGNGVNSSVVALAVFDDGGGPALYAGGAFTEADGILVNRIAKWNGTAWTALSGPSGTGVNVGSVNALTVFDDGGGPALYAGGGFTTAGGVTANRMAKWDGTAWSVLSGPHVPGVDIYVNVLAVFDDGGGPKLYAAGLFLTAGGVPVNRIAKWDGVSWSALSPPGHGVNATIYALEVSDGALYASGSFTAAGGMKTYRVAKWDGTSWSKLFGPSANGTNGNVYALTSFDDGGGTALYAGGGFTTAGGVPAMNIAKWDGAAWSALSGPSGNGLDGEVHSLKVFDDGGGPALYAGGSFTTAGGVAANRIAKWDGTSWSDLSGPSGNGMNGAIEAFTVFDDGGGTALYAGGSFTTAGGVTANRIAKWDGTAWSDLSGPSGNGTDDSVFALTVWDDGGGPALYAGGEFTTAGGMTAGSIAKWDGTGWSALSGTSVVGVIHTLAGFDSGGGPALYAAGYFSSAGGVATMGIARWNGTAWSAVPGVLNGLAVGVVRSLAVFDSSAGPALYAGGFFTTAGGLVSSGIGEYSCTWVFADGFESGNTSAWSVVFPE